MRHTLKAVLVAALLFCCAPSANAAPGIQGKLLKLDGKTPWSAQSLQLLDAKGKTLTRVLTKTDGSFTLPKLTQGTYQLQFGKAKFAVEVGANWEKVVVLVSHANAPKAPPIVIADVARTTPVAAATVGETIITGVAIGATAAGGAGGIAAAAKNRQQAKKKQRRTNFVRYQLSPN